MCQVWVLRHMRVPDAVVTVRLMYLFVRVVVGIYVVVKLLVSEVLLLTQLAVEKSFQILH